MPKNNEQRKPMTVDQLITALQYAKEKAKLKGETIVHFCIQDCPYIPVVRANHENDDSGGSVILLHPEFEP